MKIKIAADLGFAPLATPASICAEEQITVLSRHQVREHATGFLNPWIVARR